MFEYGCFFIAPLSIFTKNTSVNPYLCRQVGEYCSIGFSIRVAFLSQLFSCFSYPFFLGHFSPSVKFYPCTTVDRSCQCRFGKNFFELTLTLESGISTWLFLFCKKTFYSLVDNILSTFKQYELDFQLWFCGFAERRKINVQGG